MLGLIVRLKMRAEFRTGEFLRGHIRREDRQASGRGSSGLGLEGCDVIDVDEDQDDLLVCVAWPHDQWRCPECRCRHVICHDRRTRAWRSTPVGLRKSPSPWMCPARCVTTVAAKGRIIEAILEAAQKVARKCPREWMPNRLPATSHFLPASSGVFVTARKTDRTTCRTRSDPGTTTRSEPALYASVDRQR